MAGPFAGLAAGWAAAADDWAAWKAAFLRPDGRVVDALQDGASHSEGQGYGLALAEWFGDATAFAAIHAWTETHLARRQDPALAWRWRPGAGISDYNNASDGDLFYAWALARGARRFDQPALTGRATTIARFLAAACLAPDPRDAARQVLMPGAEGFRPLAGTLLVNPSYLMPRALRELADLTGTPLLAQAADDGVALLAELATPTGLVPDWVQMDAQGVRPSASHPAVSGYEALRCPLFLVWSGHHGHPAAIARPPGAVRVDLATGQVTERSAAPGFAAISALAAGTALPPFTAQQPYYPATLHLFAQMARQVAG